MARRYVQITIRAIVEDHDQPITERMIETDLAAAILDMPMLDAGEVSVMADLRGEVQVYKDSAYAIPFVGRR